MEKISYQVTHTLDKDELKDILTTAIEGGISYWACLGNDDPEWIAARDRYEKEHNELPCYCDTAYEVLISGHAIILYDEQDDDKRYELYWEDLMKGLRLFEENQNSSIHQSLEDGSFDAIDADMIIQYAIFDEVIYG